MSYKGHGMAPKFSHNHDLPEIYKYSTLIQIKMNIIQATHTYKEANKETTKRLKNQGASSDREGKE